MYDSRYFETVPRHLDSCTPTSWNIILPLHVVQWYTRTDTSANNTRVDLALRSRNRLIKRATIAG